MATKHEGLKDAQQQLESLIGLGHYREENEQLKDYLRKLQSRYQEPVKPSQLRKRLDKALGHKELSQVLRDMREESDH